jgi:cytochrome c oxidase assembly protein subunit 15
MGVQSQDGERATGLTDLLTIGFGTTVAIWFVVYVGHMPLIDLPPVVFVGLMLVCLLAGGWIVGRKTRRGVRGGLGLGLTVALLNLLILGSFLAEPDTGQIVPQAWLWVPGYFVVCLALAAAGAAAGSVSSPRPPEEGQGVLDSPRPPGEGQGVRAVDWLPCFAWTAFAATFLLILSGGLVTGFRAGMAVDDWPNTFGFNMFLYPFAKMTGGVFYEHVHRLLGSLVGLTALTLAILLSVERRSFGARVLVWSIGFCVLLQAVMGGLRVIDNSTNLALSMHLAVVHGFFAHVILCGMVGVAVLLAPLDSSRRPSLRVGARVMEDLTVERDEYGGVPNETDGFLATLLVLAVLGQTLLGTLVRQMDVGLMVHLSAAMLVAVLAIVVGVRLWGLYPQIAVFARGGVALMGVVVLQLILGGIALVFRTPPAAESPSAQQLQAQADALQPAVHAILTTAHQTTAAVLLAIATLLAFWVWRLMAVRASEVPAPNAETATTAQMQL